VKESGTLPAFQTMGLEWSGPYRVIDTISGLHYGICVDVPLVL